MVGIAASPSEVTPDAHQSPASPRPSAPILVVEDEAAVRTFLRFGLSHFGYPTEEAEDVPDALEKLRTRPYSLVISDYELPGRSGLDILLYLETVRPDVPFILLTGHDDISLAKRAISYGAVDFLAKPVDIHHLSRLVEQNWARVERDRRRAAELTDEILQGTVRALVAAIDAKDPHTAAHSERVAKLAVQLGEQAGLEPDRLRVLELAALLHDVGKIGIPEGILLKAGRLTEAEWAIVKQHPIRSAEIVSQVSSLAEVATIVRHHHERVDGSGYPDGLSGEAIPLLSRIITLADAYEAMTASRAYRGAMATVEARSIIRAGLGAHFDSDLGDQLLTLAE